MRRNLLIVSLLSLLLGGLFVYRRADGCCNEWCGFAIVEGED